MKAIILQHGRRMALILTISAFLGILLLTLAFLLPVGVMRAHVSVSIDSLFLNEEPTHGGALAQYIWRERESYTDAIMVQNALERVADKNAYEHAIWAYHYDLEEEVWMPENSLSHLCREWNTDSMYLHEYSRYWHGYLIYLKPLLCLFSLKQIYMMGIGVHIVLLLLVLALSVKRRKVGIGLAFLAGLLFMKPILLPASLTMSVCGTITMISLVVMLFCHDRLEEKNWYPEFFLIIGILVAYFDFLTYPVVTLGFPLCAYLLLKKGRELFGNLQKILAYSICWGIGYSGMWAMKWMIGDLTLHTGTIKDAAWSIIGRTEAIGGRTRINGGLYVIFLNLKEYGGKLYPAVAILAVILLGTVFFGFFRKLSLGQMMTELLSYGMVGAIPFVWIIAVQHHSAIHARFTFRIVSVAVMSVCCAAISLMEIEGKQKDVPLADSGQEDGRISET